MSDIYADSPTAASPSASASFLSAGSTDSWTIFGYDWKLVLGATVVVGALIATAIYFFVKNRKCAASTGSPRGSTSSTPTSSRRVTISPLPPTTSPSTSPGTSPSTLTGPTAVDEEDIEENFSNSVNINTASYNTVLDRLNAAGIPNSWFFSTEIVNNRPYASPQALKSFLVDQHQQLPDVADSITSLFDF
jgi:hypothetical protein